MDHPLPVEQAPYGGKRAWGYNFRRRVIVWYLWAQKKNPLVGWSTDSCQVLTKLIGRIQVVVVHFPIRHFCPSQADPT